MGRLVLPDYIGGSQPVGPSPIAGEGQTFAPPPPDYVGGFLPMKAYVVPREMTHADIAHAVEAYGTGAANALVAGFDGVEIHAANGYLIDQFLQSNANHRSDAYGGDLAGRSRLLREVLEAVTAVVGPGRVGIRISPTSARKGMGDENPDALADAEGGQRVQGAHADVEGFAHGCAVKRAGAHATRGPFGAGGDGRAAVNGQPFAIDGAA
jgi:2,4-dienoyl-CoA reductase-like NADH-dependent reductase (Old Yellow Enzyme family)